MEKFPFTDSGFLDLQNQLYQGSDAELETEKELILLNFRKWVAKHFTLCASQLMFLAKQDEKMINFLATQTAIAIVNRLPITLRKPSFRLENEVADSKLIRPESNFSTSSDFPNQINGEMTVEITY